MIEKPKLLKDLKGDPGIYRTVKNMMRVAIDNKDSKAVQEIADKIRKITSIPELQVIAAYDWVYENIEYEKDDVHITEHADKFGLSRKDRLDDIEYLIAPKHNISEYQKGDCDDMTMILISLFSNLGIRSRIKVIATTSHEYSHVYAEALIPEINAWVPVDPVIESFGKEYVPYKRAETFEVNG